MQSESQDLLDFGAQVIMPEDSNSNSSAPETEKSNLFGKTNPLNVTKMLKIQKSMHSQLLRLLVGRPIGTSYTCTYAVLLLVAFTSTCILGMEG